MVADWLAGDATALLAWMDAFEVHRVAAVERMWWELSTALGAVIAPPYLHQGDQPLMQTLSFMPPLLTGGAPRRLINADETAHAWRERLRQAPERGQHRDAMRTTARDLLADTHPQPDAAFALLRHHTDLPVDILAGRPIVALAGASTAAVTDLRALLPVLADAAAFDAHLQAGLSSPSLARRDLSWRLLRLPR